MEKGHLSTIELVLYVFSFCYCVNVALAHFCMPNNGNYCSPSEKNHFAQIKYIFIRKLLSHIIIKYDYYDVFSKWHLLTTDLCWYLILLFVVVWLGMRYVRFSIENCIAYNRCFELNNNIIITSWALSFCSAVFFFRSISAPTKERERTTKNPDGSCYAEHIFRMLLFIPKNLDFFFFFKHFRIFRKKNNSSNNKLFSWQL